MFRRTGLTLLPLLVLANPVLAQAPGAATGSFTPGQQQGEQPVLFTADELAHDQQLGLVVARGNVEIAQGDTVVKAEQVTYNLKQDMVTATGNVVLLDPDGNVTFADYFELTGDMKNGAAQNIRMRLADRSRLAAVSGVRSKGSVNSMARAVYSPCELCKDDPSRPPVWQLKAEKVVHDEVAKELAYEDVTLEMGGIPVFYTPYLSHPDPTVRRKSGLLAPRVGSGSNVGFHYTQPVFWAIDDQNDVTIEPTMTGNEGPVMAVEQRTAFRNGAMRNYGSFTSDSDSKKRGHIDAEGRFDVDETWRAGYVVQHASDRTYTRRYGYTFDDPYLVTRPYLEGFSDRSFARFESFAFQNLQKGVDGDRSPIVLPSAEAFYVGEPGRAGGYWTIDASAAAFHRDEGPDTRRVSLRPFWNLPHTSPLGDQYELRVGFMADGYNVSEAHGPDSGTDNFGRAVPEASLTWSFPFVRPGDWMTQVVTPMTMVAVSPRGENPDGLPNEDSQHLEFDDVNLFRPNRFAGVDRVEGGLRGAYGLRWNGHTAQGQAAEVMLGQAWRQREDSTFPQGSGFEDNLSDYVGIVSLTPVGNLTFRDRFRLDKDNLKTRFNEMAMLVGPRALRLSLAHVHINETDDEPGDLLGAPREEREQGKISVSSQMTRYWSARAGLAYDFVTDGGQPLYSTYGVTYEDECLRVDTRATFNRTYDRDYEAGHSIMLIFMFKNLGELPLSVL